jgi:ATP-dependent Clp protease adaptor protein ClpS
MKSFVDADTRTKEYGDVDVLTATEEPCSLVVWNDDVNTFEWVIETSLKYADIQKSRPSNVR